MKKALYRIEVEGRDITPLISDRFLGLTVTDSAGEDSDTFSLTLDNRDDRLEFPITGVKVRVWMGLEGEVMDKGLYTLDEVNEGLTSGEIELSGKASNMKASFKAQKTQTHESGTLNDLAVKIAKAHGYSSAVHKALADIPVGHINQRAESDMNLLTRLARENGGIMKVADDILTILPVDKAETASGVALPVTVIDDPTESDGSVTIQERGSFSAIKVSYFDEAAQKNVDVTVKGSGAGPEHHIKGAYKTPEQAAAAAAAALSKHQRGKATMSLTRPLSPGIIAPGKVQVVNHRRSANGVWYVESATHTIGDGTSGTSLSLTTEATK